MFNFQDEERIQRYDRRLLKLDPNSTQGDIQKIFAKMDLWTNSVDDWMRDILNKRESNLVPRMRLGARFNNHFISQILNDDGVLSNLYDAPDINSLDEYLENPSIVFRRIWNEYIGDFISPNESYDHFFGDVDEDEEIFNIDSVQIPNMDHAHDLVRVSHSVLDFDEKRYVKKRKMEDAVREEDEEDDYHPHYRLNKMTRRNYPEFCSSSYDSYEDF